MTIDEPWPLWPQNLYLSSDPYQQDYVSTYLQCQKLTPLSRPLGPIHLQPTYWHTIPSWTDATLQVVKIFLANAGLS